MSNKEQVWRLEDENGKKKWSLKDMEARVYFGGQEVGRVQPITMREIEVSRPVEIPRTFEVQYMGSWQMSTEELETRNVTLRARLDNVFRLVVQERQRYEERFGEAPAFFSFNRDGYESLYVDGRTGRDYYGDFGRERVMGIPIVYNPLQRDIVMALGKPEDELVRGGLYG